MLFFENYLSMMTDHAIADYLLSHPEFFNQHAELLASIRLNIPTHPGVLSLQERQMQILRDRQQQLEERLGALLRYGQENDTLASKLGRFTTQLLAERETARLPHTALAGLRDIFGIPQVGLRMWGTAKRFAHPPYTDDVGEEVRTFARQLQSPYCGTDFTLPAAHWCNEAPSDPEMQKTATVEAVAEPASIALLALRHPGIPTCPAFGLLVMGSPDVNRFHSDVATDYLAHLGAIIGAALSRLLTKTALHAA